jgi:hypothetical protein
MDGADSLPFVSVNDTEATSEFEVKVLDEGSKPPLLSAVKVSCMPST